ncbi:MAG: glutathione S-transferase family protein [Gammaproteobacteria bacterium]|nr:glutathione S-transferase family protein [Gammaproteobacteria bacterium]
MITLHHLEYSQSFRILWLLEELGVEYSLKMYERDKATHLAPPQYKALSPTSAAPVITDGELVLAESNAIMDYVLDQYPSDQLRPPPGSPQRARYLFWYHAAQGSMTPVLLMDSIFGIMQKRVPFFLRGIIAAVLEKAQHGFVKPRLETLLRKAEEDLATAPWFGGSALSAADIVISYPMESAHMRGYLSDAFPHCRAWLERIYAYPSFKVAREKDGKPSVALPL